MEMIGPIGLDIPVRREVEIREAILLYGDEDLVVEAEEIAIMEYLEDLNGLIETVVEPVEYIVYDGEEVCYCEDEEEYRRKDEYVVEWD